MHEGPFSQVSSNNISKYLVILLIKVVVRSDTHVFAKWLIHPEEKGRGGSKGRLYMQAHEIMLIK